MGPEPSTTSAVWGPRYEGSGVRVVIEVESAGGVGNLTKYWPLLAAGTLADKRFVLAHVYRLGSANDYVTHRNLWEYLRSKMCADLPEIDWEARQFTYGASDPSGLERVAEYVRTALGPAFRTQRITAADRNAGRIRFPHATKVLFPRERAYVRFGVRGYHGTGRWDPHFDRDQDRSDAQLLAFEDTWHWGPSAESTYAYLTNPAHHAGRGQDN